MICPECSERTPETSESCIMCGAIIEKEPVAEPEDETSLNLILVVGVVMLVSAIGLGYWYQNNVTGVNSWSISGVNDSKTEVVCVDINQRDQIAQLKRAGWKESSGGFVDDDKRGKKCLKKTR